MNIDDLCLKTESEDYKQAMQFIKSNTPTFETETPEKAQSYLEGLKKSRYEGGVYVFKHAGKYKVIQP